MTNAQFDAVLRFLPLFERPGARFLSKPLRLKEKKSVSLIELPENSRDVQRFQLAVHKNAAIYQWDWVEWQQTAEGYFKNPNRLKKASLLTVRRLLTLHTRKDRFCSGHLAAMLERGHIQAILRRIHELKLAEKHPLKDAVKKKGQSTE